MKPRSKMLPSERRAISALPSQRGAEILTAKERVERSSSGKRSLPLSCSSEMFQNWLSRASSAVSVQSTSSCWSSSNEGRHYQQAQGHRSRSSCGSYGRPTRARLCVCHCVCVCVCVHACVCACACT